MSEFISKDVISSRDIYRGLRRLGLREGDRVGVHSSLSSFGFVIDGADAVIDALLEAVDESGTVVMPTYSTNRRKLKRTQKEKEMGLLWKYRILPFDPETEPCWAGRIPETFWRRKEAVRGNHPMFSLAAIGQDANELCEGWDRLLEADGHILLLGVDLGSVTAMHLAEERVQFPDRILKLITMPQELKEKYPADEWETDFGPYPDFPQLEPFCRRRGIISVDKIGKSRVKLLRLRELLDLYVEILEKDPDRFYHTQ